MTRSRMGTTHPPRRMQRNYFSYISSSWWTVIRRGGSSEVISSEKVGEEHGTEEVSVYTNYTDTCRSILAYVASEESNVTFI
jgi:hypothetical protein